MGVLGEVAEASAGGDGPSQRRDQAQDRGSNGRLADAGRSHQGDPFSRTDAQVEVLDQRLAARPADGHVVQLDQEVGRRGRRRLRRQVSASDERLVQDGLDAVESDAGAGEGLGGLGEVAEDLVQGKGSEGQDREHRSVERAGRDGWPADGEGSDDRDPRAGHLDGGRDAPREGRALLGAAQGGVGGDEAIEGGGVRAVGHQIGCRPGEFVDDIGQRAAGGDGCGVRAARE